MSQWKFSPEHVAGFLYLMDQIVTYDLPKEEGNSYTTIATSVPDRASIDERTIRRAFEFRKQLLGALPADKRIPKPSLPTLDILTRYSLEGEPLPFEKYVQKNREDIERYYNTIQLSENKLNIIFKKVPDKIALLEEQVRQLEVLLADLRTHSLKAFTADIPKEQQAQLGELENANKLKTTLEQYIEDRIEATEKRLKRSALLYRFLGSFGLLFVTTPQFSDFKKFVLSTFLEDYEDDIDVTEESEDDLDDDILDAAL